MRMSRIRILKNKIHQVISDIRDINNKTKLKKTKTHKYKANPNTYHNSRRILRSGENHHPRPDWLDSEEAPGEPSPGSPTSAACSTSTVNTSVLSSSPSETGGRYAQSDPPPVTNRKSGGLEDVRRRVSQNSTIPRRSHQ